MKKIIVVFVLYCILFLFKVDFCFANEWVKSNNNPVFSPSTGLEGSTTFFPILLKEGDKYRMWYVVNNGSGWRIAYAERQNDSAPWTKSTTYAIKNGSSNGWELDSEDPFVLYEPELGYRMWYLSIGQNWYGGSDRFRMRIASSVDGINWTDNSSNSNWLSFVGSSSGWDSGGPARGKTILKLDGVYHLWYGGTDGGWTWRIGYATSPDGLTWTRQNNGQPVVTPTESWELNNVSHPNVIYEDGVFKMWYDAGAGDLSTQIVYATSTDGINWQKPASENPVLTRGACTPTREFDCVYMLSPFVMKDGDNYRMWYSGFDGQKWQIGYAEKPVAVPTPTPLNKIVLIPGLGGSWNHLNMIMGTYQPASEWYGTPGVTVYDSLITSLINAGYQNSGDNKNLFVYFYNWTQPVETTTNDFKNYIENVVKPQNGEKIDLVGHSMGGLVARNYLQKYLPDQIDKVVTVGSPHQGSVKSYYLWEGGDLTNTLDAWQRIPAGLLLYMRTGGYATTAQAARLVIPSLKDLLPTVDYLKNGQVIKPVGNMVYQNSWLTTLNTSPPEEIYDFLYTISGKINGSTLRWLNVTEADWLNKLLGNWPDGMPVGEEKADGDKTVLVESSRYGTKDYIIENLDHSALVGNKNGIQEILKLLSVDPKYAVDATQTDYTGTLVAQIASPATIKIVDQNGQTVGGGDGKLWVAPGLLKQNYTIVLTGTGNGSFELYIGQILATGNKWQTIKGQITTGEIISYVVTFDPENISGNVLLGNPGQIFKKSLDLQLTEILMFLNQGTNPGLKRMGATAINNCQRYANLKQYEDALKQIYGLQNYAWGEFKNGKLTNSDYNNLRFRLEKIIETLEILAAGSGKTYRANLVNSETNTANKALTTLENKLKTLSLAGTKPEYGQRYQAAKERLEKAKKTSGYPAHIYLLGVSYLTQ